MNEVQVLCNYYYSCGIKCGLILGLVSGVVLGYLICHYYRVRPLREVNRFLSKFTEFGHTEKGE